MAEICVTHVSRYHCVL